MSGGKERETPISIIYRGEKQRLQFTQNKEEVNKVDKLNKLNVLLQLLSIMNR